VWLAADDDAVREVHLPGGPAPTGPLAPDHPLLARARDALARYFAGDRAPLDVPAEAVEGTPFQREVWAALRAIPYGERRSYAELARAIGRPDAVRAVGAANARNPLPILVPCHRVVGADGGLVGFAGGLPAKAALLALEAHGPGGTQPGLFSARAGP
jgi:O-6-methylguanine DNA methyltransferase